MDYESQWEAVNKGLTTLMVAHAAGMVTCLTLIKDYKDTGPLKGIGVFVWLFGSGLVTAIVAAFLWLTLRGPYTADRRTGMFYALFVGTVAWSHVSLAALIAAIVFAIYKYGRL